ncbi:MAG: DUF3562 domain-containing protein [Paraburkholderia sp.]|uniref:DUF3562 domain-containing protein n=1 Tax=Paraburkholderia sp. TaxID=1926495 RepID=UPI001212FCDB|nr:DUF3562 domain-containing protein [Paraburkholderia sp.]TAM07491.1 MAG: DUF3562 domain-containing protein [Paraburkholderia sp.]TAM28773.1 MAG: DUF3562 domain-containing protein [Paraburkholderia sp.]
MAAHHVDEFIVQSIASDTDIPLETVSRMYAETWAEYSEGARITDYLPVLVARRVRDNLRRRKHDPH